MTTGDNGVDGTGASSRPPGRRRPQPRASRPQRAAPPSQQPPSQQPPSQQAARWADHFGTVPGYEFEGRRPYHFREPRAAASRRWEMWMDRDQARAVNAERHAGAAAA